MCKSWKEVYGKKKIDLWLEVGVGIRIGFTRTEPEWYLKKFNINIILFPNFSPKYSQKLNTWFWV